MEEEEFKKLCPNLHRDIMSNRQKYIIYGIEFKSHTALTFYSIRDRVEDPRAILHYNWPWSKEPLLMVLN